MMATQRNCLRITHSYINGGVEPVMRHEAAPHVYPESLGPEQSKHNQTSGHPYLREIVVVQAVSLKTELLQKIILSSLHQLVEDVEVPLSVVLMDHPGLLQQIVEDVSAQRFSLGIRAQLSSRPIRSACWGGTLQM